MANQFHRSVLLDHEMVVDGVNIRERKELNNIEANEETEANSILIHTRYIGDKKYEIQHVTDKDGNVEESVTTDLNEDEIEQFKEEWEEKWNPSIGPNRLVKIIESATRNGISHFFKNLWFWN